MHPLATHCNPNIAFHSQPIQTKIDLTNMFRDSANPKPSHLLILGTALIVAIISLTTTGCHYLAWSRACCDDALWVPESPTYSKYVSPQFNANKPRRIAMLTAGRTPGNYKETQKLISLLATKIRAAGAFEIIVPPDERLHLETDDILTGRFSERKIAELARRYNADAIGLVRVNDFRAYAPMRTSVTLAILDSAETIVTFAVDGSWDTADPGVHKQFQTYVNSNSCSNPLAVQIPSVQMQSPESLFAFVAAQIDQALQSTFY